MPLHKLAGHSHYSEYLNNGLRSPIFSNCASAYTSLHSSSVFSAFLLLILQNRNSKSNADTAPAAAKDSEVPNPVVYFGDSFSWYIKDPTIPPRFPVAIMKAIP